MDIFYQYSKNAEKEPQVYATIFSPCLHLLDFGVLAIHRLSKAVTSLKSTKSTK